MTADTSLEERTPSFAAGHSSTHTANLVRRCTAEFIGTFWLVLGGCGSAVLAAVFPNTGIGLLGVSLAFGLTVMTMAYAVGHISGCHLNPAVTLGLVLAGRFPASEIIQYSCAQIAGGIAGATALFAIASGNPAFELGAFAANGFSSHSPGGYSMEAGFLAETLLSFFFLLIVLGATDHRSPQTMAPVAVGLGLTLIHLIGIPVTNLSVNPARSTATAAIAGGWAIEQLWLFWVAPLLGAAVAGLLYPVLSPDSKG